MKPNAVFVSEFSDHDLFQPFCKWLDKINPKSDAVVMGMWRAFIAGSEARKRFPVDIAEMRKRLADQDAIALVWELSDIKDACREGKNGVELTDEQAREVLFEAERCYDANYGISWITIQTHAAMMGFLKDDDDEDDEDDDDEDEVG